MIILLHQISSLVKLCQLVIHLNLQSREGQVFTRYLTAFHSNLLSNDTHATRLACEREV